MKTTTKEARAGELARIHAIKKSLRWDDDMYRDVMAQVCGGITSAAALDQAGRTKFIAHLEKCQRSSGTVRPARQPLTAVGRKLWSLWMQAADAGLVHHRTMAALNAWLKRQTGVEHIQWLAGKQADLAIESLKNWIRRGGDEPKALPAAGDAS